MQMELSPRLLAVARRIPPGAKLADVGTDHGFLPVWLLKRGAVSRAIASDLRAAPLETARRTALRHGVAQELELRLCDGLTGIAPEEADTVVIAGMGGETIAEILAASPWAMGGDALLLLQPQTGWAELRAFLCANRCRILDEEVVRDGGRHYVLLEVRGGEPEPHSTGELWAGKNRNYPQRGAYLEWLSGVLARAAAGMEKASAGADASALDELRRAVAELEEMKKEWEAWQR